MRARRLCVWVGAASGLIMCAYKYLSSVFVYSRKQAAWWPFPGREYLECFQRDNRASSGSRFEFEVATLPSLLSRIAAGRLGHADFPTPANAS